MVAIISVVFAGNTLYYFSGAPDFGARYWYQMLVPMVVLTIRGVQEVSERTEGVSHSRKDQSRLWVFVGTAAVTAALIYVPWRSVDKYHNYRGMRADLARMEARCGFEGDLVLIQERDKSDYPSAFIFNPNTLDGEGTLYARDPGPEGRESLASLFPEREVWIYRGSEALGGPFTFISGPIDFGNPTSGIGNQSCP